MIFDLTKLKTAGKREYDFDELYSVPSGLCDLPNVEVSEPARVKGHLSILERSCYVDCEITFTLLGECSRCLEYTEKTFTCSIAEEFLGYSSEEDDAYTYSANLLKLDQAINDKIAMEIPIAFLCREDCKGLCPICGANRNENPCDCK